MRKSIPADEIQWWAIIIAAIYVINSLDIILNHERAKKK
jgi:hypothetical protein